MKKRYILILIAAACIASLSNAEWLVKLFAGMAGVAFAFWVIKNLEWKTNEIK